MAKEMTDELKLAQFLSQQASEDQKIEILNDLDVNFTITENSLAFQGKKSFLGYNYLHIAVVEFSLDLTKKLVDLDVNLLQQGILDGKTPLHKAVECVEEYARSSVSRRPNWEFVNILLFAQVKSNNSFNAKCKSGITHLHIACMTNHVKAVKFFAKSKKYIDERINLDSKRLPGYTPLHCAIQYSAPESAVVLLKAGADIYLENAQGKSVVCYLIERLLEANDNSKMFHRDYHPDNSWNNRETKNLDSIVTEIVKKNIKNDSKLVENTGLSAFHLASTGEDPNNIHYMIRNLKDINKLVTSKSTMWSGWTALHFAACCSISIFKMLLNEKADIRIKNDKGQTALDLCLQRYSPEVPLSYLSIGIVMSDKFTKLSDLMLAISKNNDSLEILQNLKNINISIPLDSPFWPGYNLLHMIIAMNRKVEPSVAVSEKNYCLNADYSITLLTDDVVQSNNPNVNFWKKFELLLSKNCNIYAKNSDGLTPIHLAFKLDDWHVTEELLSRVNKNVVGSDNVSLLHIAIAMRKIDVVDYLLKNGAEVNTALTDNFVCYKKPQFYSEMDIQNKKRRVLIRVKSTPLHISVIFRNYEAVEKLLENKADMYAQDELGLTPLHLSLNSTSSIAQMLYQSASNLQDIRREDGLSYLHVAAFADDDKTLRKLLRNGADINAFIKNTVPECFENYVGKTPLHFAIENDKAARALIGKSTTMFRENPYCNNSSPLDLSMELLNVSDPWFRKFRKISTNLIVKLKSNKIKIDALTSSGLTTLHMACTILDFDWAKKLLKRGADPNARMKVNEGWEKTPMHLAIANAVSMQNVIEKLVKFIVLLIDSGADVTISDNCETPLHLIIKAYFESKAERRADEAFLLSTADFMLSNQTSYTVNPSDTDRFSHFHFACITNNLVVIRNYLDNGVNINHSKSPLAYKKGGFIPFYFKDVYKNAGFTPLHFAVENKNIEAAQLLIERGADLNAEDTNGNTPLHLAIINNYIDLQLFDALLQKGADINAENLKGEIPLICLLHNGNVTYVQFCFFMSRGSIITEKVIDKQGIIGFIMKNTKTNDVELVLESFIEYFDIKNAIDDGFLAIHYLVSVNSIHNLTCQNYLNLIQKLVDEGSDIDQQFDENGRSALDTAIDFNNHHAIEALLLLGSNVNVVENKRRSSSIVDLCSSFNYDEDEKLTVRNHLWKMALINLDLSVSNKKIIRKWKPEDQFVQLCQSELKKIDDTTIFQSLTAKHFLSEWGAVIEYPTMSVRERQAVDDFFKRGDELRKEFPEFVGLLMMQYRKALARRKLMQPVKDILVEAGIDLPDLCLEAILNYFKNSELSCWIDGICDVSPPRKRRKI